LFANHWQLVLICSSSYNSVSIFSRCHFPQYSSMLYVVNSEVLIEYFDKTYTRMWQAHMQYLSSILKVFIF